MVSRRDSEQTPRCTPAAAAAQIVVGEAGEAMASYSSGRPCRRQPSQRAHESGPSFGKMDRNESAECTGLGGGWGCYGGGKGDSPKIPRASTQAGVEREASGAVAVPGVVLPPDNECGRQRWEMGDGRGQKSISAWFEFEWARDPLSGLRDANYGPELLYCILYTVPVLTATKLQCAA